MSDATALRPNVTHRRARVDKINANALNCVQVVKVEPATIHTNDDIEDDGEL